MVSLQGHEDTEGRQPRHVHQDRVLAICDRCDVLGRMEFGRSQLEHSGQLSWTKRWLDALPVLLGNRWRGCALRLREVHGRLRLAQTPNVNS